MNTTILPVSNSILGQRPPGLTHARLARNRIMLEAGILVYASAMALLDASFDFASSRVLAGAIRIFLAVIGTILAISACFVSRQRWRHAGGIIFLIGAVLYPLYACITLGFESCHNVQEVDEDPFCYSVHVTGHVPVQYQQIFVFYLATALIVFHLGYKAILAISVCMLSGMVMMTAYYISPSSSTEVHNVLRGFRLSVTFVALAMGYSYQEAQHATVDAQKTKLALQKTRQMRGDRIMSHHTKNIMAEVHATLTLFLSPSGDRASITDLVRCHASLGFGIHYVQKALLFTKIQLPGYVFQPMVVQVREWILQYAPPGTAFEGYGDWCEFKDSVIPDLSLPLFFSNCHSHGSGNVKVRCDFLDSGLRVDISNSVALGRESSKGNSLSRSSTGLGLEDLKFVCNLQSIPFTSRICPFDGLWHSVITLPALQVAPPEETETEVPKASHCMPPGLQIIVVDDQRCIPRVLKMKLQKHIIGSKVLPFILKNTEAFNQFKQQTIPDQCHTWDIAILDQHLPMDNADGEVKLGTNLIQTMKQSGFSGCIIMHSGNATQSDIQMYKSKGAHGAICKGTSDIATDIENIYLRFRERNC